jgi:hypothetical protein
MQNVPWGLSNPARKTDWIALENAEKGPEFRANVNGKMRCASFQAMKFLGSPNKIHSA